MGHIGHNRAGCAPRGRAIGGNAYCRLDSSGFNLEPISLKKTYRPWEFNFRVAVAVSTGAFSLGQRSKLSQLDSTLLSILHCASQCQVRRSRAMGQEWRRRRAGVLAEPNFRRFYAGYVTSLFGSAMSTVAIAWAVLDSGA